MGGSCLAALLALGLATGGSAFAVFPILPMGFGLGAAWFARWRTRVAAPARWPVILAGNGLLLAFLASLLLLGGETYYRFLVDRTDSMGNTLVARAWTARHFHTNAAGFRDNVEYPPAPAAGKRRVTFVGDSFTAGYGVKNVEDRFVNLIRRRHPEWEVHALAKPGLDTSTEVELLHRLTVSNRYQLDVVVLVYQINDIGELMPGWVAGYQAMMADRFRHHWLCQNSFFVNLLYHRWQLRRSAYFQKYFAEVEAAYRGPLWETQQLGLNALRNLTRLRGGRLLVVTFPYLDAGPRFKTVHDQLDRYWRAHEVPHLDLLPVFSNRPPAQLVVNPHDAHPNEFAHQLAAQAMDEFLRRQIPAP